MLTIHSVAGRAFATAILACAAMATFAQVADQPGANLPTIVVTAQHLNEERSRIDTQTGASTYTFNSKDIQSAPGGDNVQLNQVMLQVPDAAQDSFGQLHIRGDHNGLQFRLNGVILPDGISFFGQTLPPRMIASMKLITGSLPAEYGLRSAGIIDLTTKGGALQPGGDVSLYGGSHASIEPSFNYGGTSGSNTYFVTGDLIRNDLGIESPDGRTTPLHDHTKQYHGFGYFEHLFDETNRLSVVAGSSDDRFEIPNLAGVHAADIGAGLTVNGQTDFLSNNLNENQREVTQFAAVSLQHSAGPLSVQTSLITRYSSLNFTPDPLGDLLFNGIAEQAYKRDVAYALQSDGAYQLNESHTLRVGVYAQTDRLTSNTSSLVLQTSGGVPINDVPVAVIDETRNSQYIESAYLQDEWHINSVLVMNYGARFDHFTAFTNGSQLSPRVNFVWQAAENTTLHAGYSRFFSPPPFELVGSTTVQKFVNTTFEPTVKQDDPVKAERSNYYDVGLEQNLSKALTVGVDGYYKQAIHLIDEGQFGAPIILTPFNYARGYATGAELTTSYDIENWSLYSNFAVSQAMGKKIESGQFNFAQDELDYIATHFIHLDHDQTYTASAGVTYMVPWTRTKLSASLIYGSGLRAEGDTPNGASLPDYHQINLSIVQKVDTGWFKGLEFRLDVVNLLDEKYQIRNGTGVGVGAPQFGPRRALFAGLTQRF